MSKAFTKEPEGDDEPERPDEASMPGGFMNYITPAGHKRLNDELARLWQVDRPKLVETIAWAASNGDRSENGDYIYGKRKLREIDRRIRFLSKHLDSAVVVDNAGKTHDRVYFGATVTVAGESGSERTVSIVGVDELDPGRGRVSWISPIATALLKASRSATANCPEAHSMRCPSCHHDNRSDRRFCTECGTRLPVACPSCGAPAEAGEKFCGACGAEIVSGKQMAVGGSHSDSAPDSRLPTTDPRSYTPKHRAEGEVESRQSKVESPCSYTPRHLAEKIPNNRSALEGERKQVTVLFADVKGSMALAEQLDPEQWHSILDRFFQILGDDVARAQLLQQAQHGYDEIGAPGHAERVARLLAESPR